MPTEQVEAGPVASIDSTAPVESDLDPAYVACLEVIGGVATILQAVKKGHESAVPDAAFATQDYVDELEDAFRVGQDLLTHPEKETISQDMSQLDAEMLRELRATVGYVAPHLDVELSLPAPGGDGS